MRTALRYALILFATAASWAITGCSDDDEPTPFQPKPPSAELANPMTVLQVLQTAYEARDSVSTARVYDTGYSGSSTDLNDPPGSQTITFTRAQEIAHVAALRRSATVTGVTCDLGPPNAWTRVASDDVAHPEWAMIQIQGANIRIEIADGTSILQAGGPSEVMSFYFVGNPDATSPTDTTWKVIRWNETRAGVP